jgi:hypothetical protein
METADWEGRETRIEPDQPVGKWSLMAVVRGVPDGRPTVFEDFSQANGHLQFVDTKGVKLDLPESSEPISAGDRSLSPSDPISGLERSRRS